MSNIVTVEMLRTVFLYLRDSLYVRRISNKDKNIE
jgi:hypothetical protein